MPVDGNPKNGSILITCLTMRKRKRTSLLTFVDLGSISPESLFSSLAFVTRPNRDNVSFTNGTQRGFSSVREAGEATYSLSAPAAQLLTKYTVQAVRQKYLICLKIVWSWHGSRSVGSGRLNHSTNFAWNAIAWISTTRTPAPVANMINIKLRMNIVRYLSFPLNGWDKHPYSLS